MDNDLKVGDTVTCKDRDKLVELMIELYKQGIDTDFDYSDPKKYRLVVTKVM